MSLGSNAGGNLNILIFEVGMVTRDPNTGLEAVSTVSIHPLVVVPRSIQYTDTSRSAVGETVGGSLVTRAGRGLRVVQLSGTFGVESRGIGIYLGSGDMRFQRFYSEVVRMSDALFSEDVQAAIDVVNGSPGIQLSTAAFNEDTSTFYVNFYDFWNNISFQCLIPQFGWVREHRNGGASGMLNYNMQVREVGPLREGSGGNLLIGELLNILGTWDDINDAINSLTLTEFIDAQAALLAPAASELADTVAAVNAQLDGVTNLMGGNASRSLVTTAGIDGIASFFSSSQRLVREGVALATTLNALLGDSFEGDSGGSIRGRSVDGEGGSRSLERFEQLSRVRELVDAGAFQLIAGVFFGMSREAFREYVSSGGGLGRSAPDVGGTFVHIVTDTDTGASLEALYGVGFGAILEVNNLTPDEALRSGVRLEIPVPRARGPQGIAGLPTFGSHVGEAAWGTDLDFSLVGDGNGRPLLVSGPDVLEQGAEWLIEVFGADILGALASVPPPVHVLYVARRLTALLQSDPRVASVDDVQVDIDAAAGGFDVSVTLRAINGATIRTGARA